MNRAEMQELLRKVWDPTNSGGRSSLVVKDVEVAHLLAVTADLMDRAPCMTVDCEACNVINALWWDLCNGLHGSVRITLQRHLAGCDVPLPPGPWEEVGPNAVPTTRI